MCYNEYISVKTELYLSVWTRCYSLLVYVAMVYGRFFIISINFIKPSVATLKYIRLGCIYPTYTILYIYYIIFNLLFTLLGLGMKFRPLVQFIYTILIKGY